MNTSKFVNRQLLSFYENYYSTKVIMRKQVLHIIVNICVLNFKGHYLLINHGYSFPALHILTYVVAALNFKKKIVSFLIFRNISLKHFYDSEFK